jgi:hypothetical protein
MRRRVNCGFFAVLTLCAFGKSQAAETPIPQAWDYSAAMKEVARKFRGRPGVVLHVGDSITYSNPYGQWARAGQGQSARDKAVLAWMHTGADDETDGWWLARFDHPAGGRSYTACGGIRSEEMLAGGKQGMPPLNIILDTYHPQVVVLMLGSNDATANRPRAAFRADIDRAVELILGRGAVCILSTIPPQPNRLDLVKSYNQSLRNIAKSRSLPLIDYEQEILRRRPNDWNGTLVQKDDVHPTAAQAGATPTSAPTAENLRNSGYLLRGWLSVQKIAEVKEKVLDRLETRAAKPEPPSSPRTVAAPSGKPRRMTVTRDNLFSNVGAEADGNNGSSPRLKLKSIQEMSLVDFDPKPLRGKVVSAATLHLHVDGTERLRRVTVSSFGAEWVEGTSSSYAPQAGSSTHNHRRHHDVPWTVPGSDLCSVMLGQGGTLWRMADATAPDQGGWQTVAVDPAVIAARVAGISEGFLVFDDTGTEWKRDGERFELFHYPNRFVHSRESGRSTAPYFTVYAGSEDTKPPAPPMNVVSETGDLPAGEAWISWITPADQGPAGTVGFFAEADGKPLPRYLIPVAGRPGEHVRMHLRDLNVKRGAKLVFALRAVDGAGNQSAPTTATVRVSDREPAPLPGRQSPPPARASIPLPRLGSSRVAIVDELDKIHPLTGAMIPPQPGGYLAANHLWDAVQKTLHLHAARNEFVAFQIALFGGEPQVQASLRFEGAAAARLRPAFGRYHHVASSKGPLPDPIVPLDFPQADAIPGRKSSSIHCELFVPHDAPAGKHAGKLSLKSGESSLVLDVELQVWDFTLPDHLSFLPEMNCYDLPANERDFYRLAHLHRTYLNRVPYYQRGTIADGCAPTWDGRRLDWKAWDKRFGPYLDGSAFADLPRKSVPLDGFYLPIHENWPDPVDGNYSGDYWADRAFSDSYRRDLVEASRQFAEHINERGWKDTLFQFFLNGKNDFKRNGWSRGSSPWLLDEPANFQDYWALRYFGVAWHEGIAQARGDAKLVFRCDISRPQWQRNTFDGLLDFNVVGGAMRTYRRMVMDRKLANGELVIEYGSTNAIEDSNMQPVGWAVDSWSLGSDGILPWQTVGTPDSWTKADSLALFYPGRGAQASPLPSIRLKAYRRGQQDVEYLTLWSELKGEPRWAIGQRVREALHLAGESKGTGFAGEDAGVIHFAQLRPQDVWELRMRLGAALSQAHPEARRKLVDLRTPPRDVTKLAVGEVSPGAQP